MAANPLDGDRKGGGREQSKRLHYLGLTRTSELDNAQMSRARTSGMEFAGPQTFHPVEAF